jgi:hypothetical protein
MKATEFEQLLVRLAELHESNQPDRPWWIKKQPHDYPDGTTHFNHVLQRPGAHSEFNVAIGKYLTPELAEFLVLMRNNLPEILRHARLGLEVERLCKVD